MTKILGGSCALLSFIVQIYFVIIDSNSWRIIGSRRKSSTTNTWIKYILHMTFRICLLKSIVSLVVLIPNNGVSKTYKLFAGNLLFFPLSFLSNLFLLFSPSFFFSFVLFQPIKVRLRCLQQ